MGSFAHLFVRTAHSLASSALLVSLTRYAAITHSFAYAHVQKSYDTTLTPETDTSLSTVVQTLDERELMNLGYATKALRCPDFTTEALRCVDIATKTPRCPDVR